MMEAILDWAAAGPVEEVTLLGGEPATHPGFVKVVHAAKDRGLAVRTVTNGSKAFRAVLGDPSVAEALTRVAVSVDAPNSAAMDRLRGRGAFADAQSTIDDLKAAGIPFDINCTVVRSCVDDLPEMLHYAEKHGANRLNVHWFSAVGRARLHAPDETVDPVTWRDRVLEEVKAYRSPRSDYVVDCELAYAFGNLGDDLGACLVRKRENLQFFPSGAVFSCGLLVEDDSLSGYVWENGNLYQRPGQTEVTKAHACNDCAFRPDTDGYKAQCIYNRLVL
jgi:MoaA/NifB/PqqE/SkfB family radical SAM enzyme